MPRPGPSLEQRIQRVIEDAAYQIADMVRADLAFEIQRVVAARSRDARSGQAGRPAQSGAKSKRRNVPTHCVFPGCTNSHKGPWSSFLCIEHLGVSKADKQKHLDA